MDSFEGKFLQFANVPISLLRFGTIWKLDNPNPTLRRFYYIFRFVIRYCFVAAAIILSFAYIITTQSITVIKASTEAAFIQPVIKNKILFRMLWKMFI